MLSFYIPIKHKLNSNEAIDQVHFICYWPQKHPEPLWKRYPYSSLFHDIMKCQALVVVTCQASQGYSDRVRPFRGWVGLKLLHMECFSWLWRCLMACNWKKTVPLKTVDHCNASRCSDLSLRVHLDALQVLLASHFLWFWRWLPFRLLKRHSLKILASYWMTAEPFIAFFSFETNWD